MAVWRQGFEMRLSLVIVVICLVLSPVAVGADFLIILKNGSRFTTPEYWHTYEELRFYYLGGTVGIKRSTVKKIVSLQPPYKEENLTTDQVPPPQSEGRQVPPASLRKETIPPQAEEVVYSKKIDAVTARIAELKTMSREELLALSAEIAALKKEIVNRNLMGLYEGKYQELFTANDAIKEELRKRFQ